MDDKNNPLNPSNFDNSNNKDSKKTRVNQDQEVQHNENQEASGLKQDLYSENTFINHFGSLKNKDRLIKHHAILSKLLTHIKEVDFEKIAQPKLVAWRDKLNNSQSKTDQEKQLKKQLSKIKVNEKQYVVIVIEQIIKLAEENKWGLCKNHDFIYLYNGAYWEHIHPEEFQNFLGDAAERMGVKWDSARYYKFKEKLFKQFVSTAYLPSPKMKKDTVLINLLNGTFEITPQRQFLRVFKKSDFLTYQLPFEYKSDAKAPIFLKYLNRVLPNLDLKKVLAEYLGFLFIQQGSILKEEKALILYGTGANGKSVLFEIVNALLGSENVSNFSLQSLTNENGYYRAKIANKLVNYASEINGKLESSIFKQLVSGEPVEARLPYGQPFTLRRFAKLIFNCNELPTDVEHTNAFFRRFLILHFAVTIPKAEQDKQLHNKIIDNELSGVFLWVLDGLTRLLNQKHFTDSDSITKAVDDFKVQSDSVKLFLSEFGYTRSLDAYKKLKDIYNEYRIFCYDDGYKKVSKKTFRKRLEDDGLDITKKSLGIVVYITKSFS